MHTDAPFIVAAPAHPSLDGAIVRFCDALREETRPAGRDGTTAANAVALVARLGSNQPGLRLAAVHDGDIVGLARVDTAVPSGAELLVAVVPHWRRRGVALALGRAILARAHAAGVDRIVLATSAPAVALRGLGATAGFQVVDLGGGRLDLVRTLLPASRSA